MIALILPASRCGFLFRVSVTVAFAIAPTFMSPACARVKPAPVAC